MRLKLVLTLSLLFIFAFNATAQDWNVDKAHSSFGFSVRHMVISKTTGKFHDFEGKVSFDGENTDKGSVELSIQTASIDTDNEERDTHLKSADFFDVEKFPTMSFKSTSSTPIKDGNFQLTGDITIKGVTTTVTFDCNFHGAIADPWGNTRAGFSASTKISRKEFGLTWNKALETGGLIVGDEVTINLELELVQAKEVAEEKKEG